jgi:hypothetical protein
MSKCCFPIDHHGVNYKKKYHLRPAPSLGHPLSYGPLGKVSYGVGPADTDDAGAPAIADVGALSIRSGGKFGKPWPCGGANPDCTGGSVDTGECE